MAFVVGGFAFIATILGGLFALRFKDRLHLVLGFSAGAVIGVALFELIPEAFELAGKKIPLFCGIGFAVYLILDRLILMHSHDENSNGRGKLGAGSLSLHSFLDGLAVGLAFKASEAVGLVVTAAVLTHDFSDGINTANLILKNNGSVRQAFFWVLSDALAPVIGIFSTLFFNLPQSLLGIILAFFAGDFIYIGASDLLPESHHRHPKKLTTFMTLLGMGIVYLIIWVS